MTRKRRQSRALRASEHQLRRAETIGPGHVLPLIKGETGIFSAGIALTKDVLHCFHSRFCKSVASWVVGGGKFMNNVFCTKSREITAELGAPVTANGGGPAQNVEPCRKYAYDCFGREGAELLVKRIAAPMVHADEE